MRFNIKHFIEENIELIEQEQWIAFWELAVMKFPNNMEVMELVDILYDAGIESHQDARELLLFDQINQAIVKFNSGKRSTLTIGEFIDSIPLNRRFGFDIGEISNFIHMNAKTLNCEFMVINGRYTLVKAR